MTEDEARQKWCPFSRIADPNAMTGGNRRYRQQGGGAAPAKHAFNQATRCIASECMAWRWKLVVKEHHPMQLIIEPDEYSETDGYCGLAR